MELIASVFQAEHEQQQDDADFRADVDEFLAELQRQQTAVAEGPKSAQQIKAVWPRIHTDEPGGPRPLPTQLQARNPVRSVKIPLVSISAAANKGMGWTFFGKERRLSDL